MLEPKPKFRKLYVVHQQTIENGMPCIYLYINTHLEFHEVLTTYIISDYPVGRRHECEDKSSPARSDELDDSLSVSLISSSRYESAE